ncbi:MAG TPA: hypothetical protein VK453_23435 [Micromonosporaceae bacterium]|nr:hypothetical protein [Micromonosporaceae bacterium]
MKTSIRRMVPVLLVVAFALWIILITVLIAVSPDSGTGNPAD